MGSGPSSRPLGEQPAAPVGHHDEGVRSGDRVHPSRALRGTVGGGLVRREVGHVVAGPATLALVPPDVSLALGPRPALGVRRGAVVEQATVCRPRPPPLRRHPAAGGVEVARLAPPRLVDAVAHHAGVDPAAAGGAPVRAERAEAGHRLAVRGGVAVYLLQHRTHVGLPLGAVLGEVPPEVEDRPVAVAVGVRVALLHPQRQVVHEPQLRARVAGRLEGLVTPLQQALGVGERALLLDVRGGRHQEDLGGDVLGAQLARLDLRRSPPELGRLDGRQIAHHQPAQSRESPALQAGVLRAHGRVLTHHQQPVQPAVQRAQHRREVRVVAGDLRQVPKAELVLRSGGVAEPGLQQRDRVAVEVRPPPALRAAGGAEPGKALRLLVRRWHGEVAGQQVVQRRDVGRPLDRRVPAQGEDASAGPPDVAEQQLQDRGRPDDLHARAVLGPAHRVAERGGALTAGVGHERLGHGEQVGARDPADPLDHLRRVAAEVPLEDLEHAARVLEGLVAADVADEHAGTRLLGEGLRGVLAHAGGRRHLATLVHPRRAVVHAGVGIESGEQPAEVLRVAEVLVHDRRGVGVVDHVLPEPRVGLDHVPDQTAEEGDVRARADRDVLVGERARA